LLINENFSLTGGIPGNVAAGPDMRGVHILLRMHATGAWRLTPISIFASKQGSLFFALKETESASP